MRTTTSNHFIIIAIAAAMASSVLQGCKVQIPLYQYDAECISLGSSDGLQVISISGMGNNEDECRENAQKNAVHAFIFKGIKVSQNGRFNPCARERMTREPMSEHQSFWDEFFGPSGSYGDYITQKMNPPYKRIRNAEDKSLTLFFEYHVDIRTLRQDLEREGVIPSANILN